MKLKWIVPFALAAIVGFLAVPAMACGGHGESASNDTITASTDSDEAPAAEPAAEPAATGGHECTCQHGQQAAEEQPADSDSESDTELTDTAPTEADSACPHAQAAANPDQS